MTSGCENRKMTRKCCGHLAWPLLCTLRSVVGAVLAALVAHGRWGWLAAVDGA